MQSVSQPVRKPKIAAHGNALRRRRPGLVIKTLTGAREQSSKRLIETDVVRVGSGITESSRKIRALEIIALEAQLLCRIVGANFSQTRIAKYAIAGRIYKTGPEDRSRARL